MKIRDWLVSFFVLGFLLISPSVASAHASLATANPASDAVLKDLPARIVLEFDDNLLVLKEHNTSVLIVKDRFGTEIESGEAQVQGRTLSVALPNTHEFGEFWVTWRVVSDDGHPVQGSYSFSVEVPEGATAQDLPLTSLIHETAPKGAISESGKVGQSAETPNRLPIIFLVLIVGVGVAIWARFNSARKRKARSETFVS